MPKIVGETCFRTRPSWMELVRCNRYETSRWRRLYKCSETRLVFSGLSRLACSSCFVKSFLTPTSRTGSRVIDPKCACCCQLEVRAIMIYVASSSVLLLSARNAKDSRWSLFPHSAQLDGTCNVQQVWNVKMVQTLTCKWLKQVGCKCLVCGWTA